MDPGQLGHRPGGRLEVQLLAPLRHHDLEPDGDSAPVAFAQAGHRHRARSRPGLPRSLFSKPVSFFLWVHLRDRHCGLRPGGSDRVRHRAAICSSACRSWPASASRRSMCLFVLFLQNKGFRYIEALVITLILIIGGCFAWEIVVSHPNVFGIVKGLCPSPQDRDRSRDALHRHRHPGRHGHAA